MVRKNVMLFANIHDETYSLTISKKGNHYNVKFLRGYGLSIKVKLWKRERKSICINVFRYYLINCP